MPHVLYNQAMLEITAFELAKYLVKTGHTDKASAILNDLIARDLRSVSPRCVRTFAQIAYDCRNWNDAAVLWRIAAGADPNNIEAWIKLAHCLLELDQIADAEVCASKGKLLCERALQSDAEVDLDELLACIYQQICLHFLRNAWPKANDLLRLFGLPGSYLGRVTNGAGAANVGESLRDQDIQRRLDMALTQWEANRCTVPYLQQQHGLPGSESIFAMRPAKRILLVLRKYFLSRSDSREHELAVFFQASARAVGLETLFFPADPFLNPAAITPEKQYSELDRLGRLILSAKPDLVIFDDLCNQQFGSEFIGPEVYRKVFCALKAMHPFKLVGLYADAWMPKSWTILDLTSSFLDVVWPLAACSAASWERFPGTRVFWAPIPYPDHHFAVQPSGKDINAAFVGGLFDYNSPRGVWLTLIKLRRIPCQLFLSTHTMSGSKAGATPEEYAAFMSRLRISVNFSARATAKKVMTGRAWESIIAKSLLLEEDNEEIKRFFVPFVHYIPFKNIDELQAYLSFFERNESARRAMAERAFDWFQRLYSKERIWSGLLATALQ